MRLLGVDTGGTFTDFVLLEGGRLRVHKVLSTPEAPERAIVAGIAELGGAAALSVAHGSTVATNALLEGKGARTAFVTNRGFRDLLAIGRQARRGLYDLAPAPVAPPVPEALCLETGGRRGADGRVVEALTEDDLALLREQLAGLAPEAVAVDLLFSFLDPRFEREVAAVAPPGAFVACSHEVLPELREYERGIATWIAASLGPRVAGYLSRLGAALPGTPVSVMQSSGQTVDARAAARRAAHLLLSGPAGGLIGARVVAEQCRIEGAAAGVLTFDMGGTSTDVALVEGEAPLTREGRVAGYPVAVPMVDMHTIGAGGGSIAWRDAGGMLRVGPRSAGAAPGPACYGKGGSEPTVTDANLVLGRLVPDAFLGGRLALDRAAAERAVGGLADALGLALEACALGIVRLADEHMANALRVMSVQRGRDPRQLALLSFGGAGGLHVCALAEALGMRHAIVPARAGVLSAFGMLAAPRGRDLARSVVGADSTRWLADPAALERAFEALEGEARAALAAEGLTEDLTARRRVDLRYRGQHHALTVPVAGAGRTRHELEDAFHLLHRSRYGHALSMPVELVAIGTTLSAPPPALPDGAPDDDPLAVQPTAITTMPGAAGPVTVIARAALERGVLLAGPAILIDAHATTWLAPGWRAHVDRAGHLHLTRPG
jgi:N-methylhydantoinase A